jgi:hypothetical protein
MSIQEQSIDDPSGVDIVTEEPCPNRFLNEYFIQRKDAFRKLAAIREKVNIQSNSCRENKTKQSK